MAEVKPLKLTDLGNGAGRLEELATGDTLPKAALPALAKADVGLANVDNTSDLSKPVSTATQTALNAKAPLASPTFTGTPKAPTPATTDNSTLIANTAFVQAVVAALVNGAPGALNELNELAAAMGNDPNFATTMLNALALKAPLASPALTGNPTAPTAVADDNDTSIATTAHVKAAMALFGIGADVPLSTLANIDDKSLRGWRYVVDATAGTKPTPFGVVFTFGNTGDQIAQEFWEVTGGAASGTLRRWYRQVYGAGEWGTWRQLLHTGNILGAVSQSGGVPTGAIIERGSNANGEYVRFADGTQICTMLIQGGIAMGSYGSTGLYMGVLVCQFPAVFANAPSISGVSTDQNNLGWVTSNGIGQGVANIYHITASSTVTSTAIFLLAIGRWF